MLLIATCSNELTSLPWCDVCQASTLRTIECSTGGDRIDDIGDECDERRNYAATLVGGVYAKLSPQLGDGFSEPPSRVCLTHWPVE